MKVNCNDCWKGEGISLKTCDFTGDLKVTNVRLGLKLLLIASNLNNGVGSAISGNKMIEKFGF